MDREGEGGLEKRFGKGGWYGGWERGGNVKRVERGDERVDA